MAIDCIVLYYKAPISLHCTLDLLTALYYKTFSTQLYFSEAVDCTLLHVQGRLKLYFLSDVYTLILPDILYSTLL